MPLIAIPVIYAITEAIIVASTIVVGAALLLSIVDRIADYIAKELSDAISKARECQNCKCSQCVPPVGSIGIRIDWVPPSRAHRPCPSHHVHFYIRSQNPGDCICFWKPKKKKVLCLDTSDSPDQFDPSSLGEGVTVL